MTEAELEAAIAAATNSTRRARLEQRLYDRSDEFDDEDGDGLALQISPEQWARVEEVQSGWNESKLAKRAANSRSAVSPEHWMPPQVDIDGDGRAGKWSLDDERGAGA